MVVLPVVRLSLFLRGRVAAVRPPPPPLDLATQRIGLSFTPGGLLYPYQLGAATALVDAGICTPSTPLAGASSGGILAVTVALAGAGAASLDDTLRAAYRINDYCRDNGDTGGNGNLGAALAAECDTLLDDASADLLNGREGSVTLAVTQLLPVPRALRVSAFIDREDVKNTILATSCVPFYFKKTPAMMYRGAVCVDGIFAVRRRHFGAPELSDVDATVRICPFPVGNVGLDAPHVIAPDAADSGALARMALASPAASNGALRDLFDRGRRDADAWLLRQARS